MKEERLENLLDRILDLKRAFKAMGAVNELTLQLDDHEFGYFLHGEFRRRCQDFQSEPVPVFSSSEGPMMEMAIAGVKIQWPARQMPLKRGGFDYI